MKYTNRMEDLLKKVRQKEIDLSESKLNETGHDDVKSAKNQVQIAMSALQKMSAELDKLNDEDSLPTWWTNKVAISVDKLDGMADYLDTQVESKQVNEESMKCPRCGTMNETPFDKCSNCGLPKAEFSSFKKEEVEELDEGKVKQMRDAGVELEKYAKKSGGIDKNDMMKAAGMMKKLDLNGLAKFVKSMDTDPRDKVMQTVIDYVGKDAAKRMFEEVELDESKSSSGYELYHKDFSSAMQHAYDFAKNRMGVTVDKKEIDDKVATGPRKPSEGKTNRYRLRGKGGNLQIQVYNRGGSKPFELNMYKEEVELDEAVLAGRDYKYDGKGSVRISKKNYAKVQRDSKSVVKGKPMMMVLNPKTQATELVPVQFEEVELDEASARRDAMRDMGKVKDKESDDIVATADDRKAADKNIIMQLRRLQDMGKGKAMFADNKSASINPRLIDYALKMHGKMKPQDKLKFQKAISKSYKDFLMTLKRTR